MRAGHWLKLWLHHPVGVMGNGRRLERGRSFELFDRDKYNFKSYHGPVFCARNTDVFGSITDIRM